MFSKTLGFTLLCLLPIASFAAEIKVLSAGAVKPALAPLIDSYRAHTGDSVNISYGAMGAIKDKIAAGEPADVVIGTPEGLADIEKQGKLVAGSQVPLGIVGMALAVRAGAASPDISTPERLKQALLKATTIGYPDPVKATSGKHFASVLQRLGIADAVKAKTVTKGDGALVADAVAKGEIELMAGQASEILPVTALKLVGPLPGDLQKVTTYSAAVAADAKSSQAAAAFIRYLTSKDGRAVFASKGFDAPK